MSHFTVMIIGAGTEDEVENALKPFCELDLSPEDMASDPRAEFNVQFTAKEAEQDYIKFIVTVPSDKQIEYAHKNLFKKGIDPVFSLKKIEPIEKEALKKWCEENSVDEFCLQEKITLQKYPDIETYMSKWYGYSKRSNGSWGYFHNLNAKWDWYQIGGRWAGYFRLKEAGKEAGFGRKGSTSLMLSEESRQKIAENDMRVDMARIGDIDFEGMELENQANSISSWEKCWKEYPVKMEEQEGELVDINKGHRYFRFGVRKDDTKEKYLKRRTSLATFAVLKDGEWFESGDVGWWGFVSDEKDTDIWEIEFNEKLKDLPDDTYVTIVDCHI